ncbi:uncharacterized protein LOC114176345 isoform X1 [Vigna unguiculata]|uniref:uncharacterized protein LOC114176345 isoform X1 n=1 Tax=Vigna unguiculata TaxID=3917 RepID=UPI0010168F53|nr:uncharacterized protein LOC114176345 isoform X1 [Vigna unguiculata]
MGAELVVTWNTWEELLLGGAILRHGTRDWTVVAAELKTRTVSPFSFTPEVCKAKYEELRQQYSGCIVLWLHDIIRAWFEELKKKRVAELKRDLELSEELIGSLELKLESLKTGMDEKRVDCHVDDGSVGPELHVSLEKLDRVVPSAKEMSKDGLSAGSFTHESQTNWSHECKVPAMSCEDVETKPEVSGSTEQEKVLNVDKSTHTIYEGQGGCLKKRRGKRKRKDCGKNTNEASVRESDLSADVCKESSTSNCDEIEKSSGKDEAKANFKKDEIKDLMELLDSFLSVQGASAFCRRHDSQKRGRYKKTVRQHMDFDTIRSRINNGTIKSMMELIRDLLLLTNNAILFYSKITREYKIALKLRDLAIKTSAEKLKFLSSSNASTSLPVPDPQVKVRSMSTSPVRDPPVKATSITASPVHDPSMKVRSMRPGNRKIVAKVAGGNSSAERVSLRAKKEANKVESPSSVESLPIKKAFGGRTKKVVRESAGQRHATPRKGRKRGKTK